VVVKLINTINSRKKNIVKTVGGLKWLLTFCKLAMGGTFENEFFT